MLRGAPGVRPMFVPNGDFPNVTVENPLGVGPLTVELSGFDVETGSVTVRTREPGGHRIVIRDVAVHHRFVGEIMDAIELDLRAPTDVVLERCRIIAPGIGIRYDALTATPGTFSLHAVANHVHTGDDGFDIDVRGASVAAVDLLNNVVEGGAALQSVGDGIAISAHDSADTVANIVNNTVDDATLDGVAVRLLGPAARLAVNVFNNVLIRGRRGLAIDASPGLTAAIDANAFFLNAQPPDFGGHPSGLVLDVDPGFVFPGTDYHLRPGSPLRDVGRNDPPGGLPPTDADGNPRVAGAAVDLGAYELPGSIVQLPVEICGNCVDDDGNGRVDFEDAACCPGAAARDLGLRRARIARKGTRSSLALRMTMPGAWPLGPAGTEYEVFVHLRRGPDALICATLPAAAVRTVGDRLSFRDRKGRVASALGLDGVTLRRRGRNHQLAVRARSAAFATPDAGPFEVTLAIRPPGAAGEVCAGTVANLRARRKGRLLVR